MSARFEEEWFKNIVWNMIDLFIEKNGQVQHHIDSYHWFVNEFVPEFIDNFPEIRMTDQIKKTEHIVKFTRYSMKKPFSQEYESDKQPLTPLECRLRNFTYSAKIFFDVIHTEISSKDSTTTIIDEIPIGELPVMVQSDKCVLWGKTEEEVCEYGESPLDPGGYFIMKGGERVIIAQENMSPNYVHVSQKDGITRAEVRSANEIGKQTTTKVLWTENKKVGKVVRIDLAFIKQDIPLVALFRALGVQTFEEITNHILIGEENEELTQMLAASFDEMNIIKDQETALYFISMHSISDMKGTVEERCDKAKTYLKRELFPHIDDGPMWEIRKAMYLGYVIKRLLLVVQGKIEMDDRDHYKNKRIATTGVLLAELFQDRFKKMVSDLRKYMHNCFEKGNIVLFRQGIKTKYIKTGIANAMKTGNWNPNKHSGAKNKSNAKQGVAQVLNRLTNLATLSHMRRMNTPMGKEGQQQKARQLHNSQWGVACLAETPEGGSCLTLDTMINIGNNMYQNIGSLKDGDTVETIDPITFKSSLTSITKYFIIEKPVHKIQFSNGTTINATGDHPFLTKDGWKIVDDLTTNSFVLSYTQPDNYIYVKIVNISPGNVERVADFTTLSDNHSFVANGVVTHNCGLVKNIPIMTQITIGQSGVLITEWLKRNNLIVQIEELLPQQIKKQWKIKVNGAWIGIIPRVTTFEKALEWIKIFKKARQKHEVYRFATIAWNVNETEIEIFTDGGRPCRPLLVVENGKLVLCQDHVNLITTGHWTWEDILEHGIIEYVDTAEQTNGSSDNRAGGTFIAMFPSEITINHTHCEIHPSMMLGVAASIIPYPDHNQSPRNT
jgi:DNA-directed RNA polymerase beta subunit